MRGGRRGRILSCVSAGVMQSAVGVSRVADRSSQEDPMFDRRYIHQRLTPGMRAAATMAAVAALVLLPVMTAAAAAPAPTALHSAAPTGPAAVPGEIVVAFESGVGASERVAARSAADVRAKRSMLLPGAQLVEVEAGQTVADAITALEKRP